MGFRGWLITPFPHSEPRERQDTEVKHETVSFITDKASLTPKETVLHTHWNVLIVIMFTALKLRVMLYSVGMFRSSGSGGSISRDPERTALRRREEGPG